jgi:predicted ATPase/class 3 adenylate cyclase
MGAPSGTVTFLFTDIEGSTGLWESAPEAMRAALARHDEIVRGSIEAHDGYVFSTGGDGFGAAFARAGDAVGAAVDVQRGLARVSWPRDAPIRVRMGVHTGEASERDGDYFGPAVNRAARVMGAAPSGQIVVSGVTAELTAPQAGVALVDLGSHRLRGVTEPMRVWGVRADGLAGFEGRLATDRAATGNLPRPVTEMVGRTGEVNRLVGDLGARRLVTLTGPGGVGKTRTAVEAGWLAAGEFTDGVWLVDLGPVTDPAAVPFTAAATLGAQPRAALGVADAIVDTLGDRRVLILVDNCEHLLDAAAALITRIMAECPAVVVLATSREPLGLPGERVRVVSSLDPLLEGVDLFCDRAATADDLFVCDESDRAVIGEICTRLDGIPLAIELAAARVRSMTPSDVLARLDDRFRVLRGGARGGVERHQTLRAAVAWSYQLLGEAERGLFERASVFAGGFDLAAAAAVCAGPDSGLGDTDDVADVLAGLVDKSMLLVDRSSRSSRYRMLETLRQYGEERLGERGDAVRVHDRHLAHYQLVADRASEAFTGPGQLDALRTGEREWDNLRAAFEWAQTIGDIERAVALALACDRFAHTSLRFEHSQWTDALIARTPSDHPSRCSLYASAALWATLAGETELALRLGQLGTEVAGSCPGGAAPMLCWGAEALAYSALGRDGDALAALREAESRVGDDAYTLGAWLQIAGPVAYPSADPATRASLRSRFQELATRCGAPLWKAIAVAQTGWDLFLGGRAREARDAFQEALRLLEDVRPGTRAMFLAGLAESAAALNDDATPGALRFALSDAYALRIWWPVWSTVELVALHWIQIGGLEPAAVSLGHLEAHGHANPGYGASRAEAITVLDAHPDLADARARGAAMDRDELVAYVLDHLDQRDDN